MSDLRPTGDRGNIFDALAGTPGQELIQTLLQRPDVRIERIVSHGESSPAGLWYDQPQGEWVLLLAGSARLAFQEPDEIVELSQGDWIFITPHRRHRVDSTQIDAATVWLAIFC